MPSDAHHLRFARHRALGRKVSDEFTVPLCRGHHREVHRSGDEAAWWKKTGIDPTVTARALWLQTHPLPTTSEKTSLEGATSACCDLGAPAALENAPDADVANGLEGPFDVSYWYSVVWLQVEYEWDEAKAATNFAKHGISFTAAARALQDPRKIVDS